MRVLNVIGEMGFGGAELQTIEIARRIRSPSVGVGVAVIGYCDGAVRKRIESDGIDLILLHSRLLSLVNIVRLVRIIRRGNFDVVHAHLFPSLYWVAFAAIFLPRKTRLIYTEHSTNNGRRKWGWLRWLEGWIYSQYDSVICITDDVKNALLSWVPRLSSIVVIENGIDIDRFRNAKARSRREFGLSDHDRVIVMAGAFRQEKNHEALVKSILMLSDDCKLILAGDGPELPRIRSLVEALGLRGRVLLPGVMTDVECLFKMADVYILPSHYEGFGLSAVEAAAAGLPVVYADVAGLGTLFSGAGIAVDPNGVASIAAGIKSILDSESVRKDLIMKGREIANKYDIELTAKRYLQVYQGDAGV